MLSLCCVIWRKVGWQSLVITNVISETALSRELYWGWPVNVHMMRCMRCFQGNITMAGDTLSCCMSASGYAILFSRVTSQQSVARDTLSCRMTTGAGGRSHVFFRVTSQQSVASDTLSYHMITGGVLHFFFRVILQLSQTDSEVAMETSGVCLAASQTQNLPWKWPLLIR